jgi:translation elongation factor EF-Tu-like GTPase
MIIGTAGHIDHGKTALVKALTGVDAGWEGSSAASPSTWASAYLHRHRGLSCPACW